MNKQSYFVTDADNYIQSAIVDHISRMPEEKLMLRVTYATPGRKKAGRVTKVLNKDKAKLMRSYLQKCGYFFIDLIWNQSMEKDAQIICSSIEAIKAFEEEIKVVVLSSVATWRDTNAFDIENEQFLQRAARQNRPSKAASSENQLDADATPQDSSQGPDIQSSNEAG